MNESILLAALLRGPAYGYALQKTAGLIFEGRTLHSNVVYPLLKKFMHNGWVEQGSTPGERGQTRKQYRITAAGTKYLLEELSQFTEQDAADESAFLFRVALFDLLSPQLRQSIVAARESYLNARAIQLWKLREEVRPESFGAVALERVRTVAANELRWLRQLRRTLESKKGDSKCKPLLTPLATARP